MYDLSFYIAFFIICAIISIPFIIFVIIFLWLQSSKSVAKPSLVKILEDAKQARDVSEVTKNYKDFLKYYPKIPVDEKKSQEWLEIVKELVMLPLASVEIIVDFQEKLEKENNQKQKEIANMIANILKTKKSNY